MVHRATGVGARPRPKGGGGRTGPRATRRRGAAAKARRGQGGAGPMPGVTQQATLSRWRVQTRRKTGRGPVCPVGMGRVASLSGRSSTRPCEEATPKPWDLPHPRPLPPPWAVGIGPPGGGPGGDRGAGQHAGSGAAVETPEVPPHPPVVRRRGGLRGRRRRHRRRPHRRQRRPGHPRVRRCLVCVRSSGPGPLSLPPFLPTTGDR